MQEKGQFQIQQSFHRNKIVFSSIFPLLPPFPPLFSPSLFFFHHTLILSWFRVWTFAVSFIMRVRSDCLFSNCWIWDGQKCLLFSSNLFLFFCIILG